MLTLTIEAYKANTAGKPPTVLAYVNSVAADLELAKVKAAAVLHAINADGVQLLSGDEVVWRLRADDRIVKL